MHLNPLFNTAFTKYVDAHVYYIDPEAEEMPGDSNVAHPNRLSDSNVTDGHAKMRAFLMNVRATDDSTKCEHAPVYCIDAEAKEMKVVHPYLLFHGYVTDFMKYVDAPVYYISPEAEEMIVTKLLFDLHVTDI